MDLVFLGPPGAGKGTQAKLAASRLGIAHLSTGDMLRSAVREGSRVGREVSPLLDQGRLVPDATVQALVAEVLGSAQCREGFVLDGYPRNLAQAQALDDVERASDRSLTAVILIDVADEDIERRLTGRRSCPKAGCGAMYHKVSNPPTTAGICDRCGTELVVRADDNPDTIHRRLSVYHKETRPLLDYYESRELLARVDGTMAIAQVQDAIAATVKVG